MGIRAAITSKGQITIPKELRDRSNPHPGATIGFTGENGNAWVMPRNAKAAALFSILGPSSAKLNGEEIDRVAIADHLNSSSGADAGRAYTVILTAAPHSTFPAWSSSHE
ncbi:AbrB/MazE/SpoVT family DNA-binding domain-containing protein [Chelativorans sp. AA-79]|uniref:AbrB/MazE/SpoVT family DNA-binding domain-containing protein n=1 Tax=Chelativorans sp. AA-79 TaxID=3028735 RepID=UPI0023F7EAA9|nr:AbrB/MazE/SpoVT family DNA-binding domain-containing protein [Chelativorans sp. AA-79]WEX09992.1 AbrB/MazE/SpoVT family DNA-binding domain-containing protein [Chelativorans sp. AA-79]